MSDKKVGLLEGIPTSWSPISVFVYSSLRLLLYKERNVSAGLSGRRIRVLSAFVSTPEGAEDGGATCKDGSWQHDKTSGHECFVLQWLE